MQIRSTVVRSCAAGLLILAAGHAQSDPRANGPAGRTAQAITPDANRADLMRHHFGLVMAVHEATLRGDLKMARQHARALADQPDPPNLPAAAGLYLATMKAAASGLSTAEELEDVAAATSSMLSLCGDCHRAVGTMPATAMPSSPVVGGTVGHMLAHKRAVDLMVLGLTVPSASLWREGANALDAAPLRRRDLPKDPKLTSEILATERLVHEMAERARQATDARSRVYVYSEVIQSCGTCHALHGNVWGPDKK